MLSKGRRFPPAAFLFYKAAMGRTFPPSVWRALAFALSCMPACVLASSAIAQTTIIGVAGPVSGPLREAGEAMRAGVLSAIASHQAAGATFEVMTLDDAGSQSTAIGIAQKLIAAKARFVIGHHASAPSLAAAPLYAKAGIVMISPTAASPKLNASALWNAIRLSPGEDDAAIAAARDLTKMHGASLAIAHDGNAQAQALATLAAKAANLKTPVISFGSPKSSKLPDLRNAAILWTGSSATGARFLQHLRELDAKAFLFSHGPLSAPDFAEAAGAQAAGVRALTPANYWRPIPPELQKAWRAQGIRDLRTALLAHAATQIGLAALGETDGKAMAAKIRSGETFATIAGALRFNSDGSPQGAAHFWLEWVIAEDGKPALVPALRN